MHQLHDTIDAPRKNCRSGPMRIDCHENDPIFNNYSPFCIKKSVKNNSCETSFTIKIHTKRPFFENGTKSAMRKFCWD